MEFVIAIVIGVVFATGIYLLLSRRLIRVLLGTTLLSHAALLLLMTMGGLKRGAAPILDGSSGPFVDPIPQALILTAIVIGFGVTSFIIVLSYRAYQKMGSDDTNDFVEPQDEQAAQLEEAEH